MNKPDCRSCLHSMQGADLVLRCRQYGYPCSPEAAEGCKKFIYLPGTDAEEAEQMRGLCPVIAGRGD